MNEPTTWVYHASNETAERVGILVVHHDPTRHTLFSYTSFDGYSLQQTRPPSTPFILDLSGVAGLLEDLDGAVLFAAAKGSPYGKAT